MDSEGSDPNPYRVTDQDTQLSTYGRSNIPEEDKRFFTLLIGCSLASWCNVLLLAGNVFVLASLMVLAHVSGLMIFRRANWGRIIITQLVIVSLLWPQLFAYPVVHEWQQDFVEWQRQR